MKTIKQAAREYAERTDKALAEYVSEDFIAGAEYALDFINTKYELYAMSKMDSSVTQKINTEFTACLADFRAGAAFAQRWISVEEELPEEKRDIIIKRDFNYVLVCGYYVREDKSFYCPYVSYPLSHVTHWRYVELNTSEV